MTQNAVFFLLFDTTPAQHELTKVALASVMEQDIPVDIFVIDNGSTHPPTREWLDTFVIGHPQCRVFRELTNHSPVKVSNEYLAHIFNGYAHVLCVPSDVRLPPNLYREFLRFPRGVVTGSMTTDKQFPLTDLAKAVNECTPMAVVMWRKWVHDALVERDGFFFDPLFHFYASDCDLALRLCASGIRGVQLDLQYFHHGSASHRLALPNKISAMAYGADRDRLKFERKWNFKVFDPQYSAAATDINFRGEPLCPK